MAGQGVRLFTAGSQLLASQVNGYLMDQVVCYFVDAGARTAAFGNSGQPSLSPGRLSYLLSDNKLYLYGNDNEWREIGAQLDDGEVTSAKLANSLTLAGTTTFGQIIEKATTDSSTVLSSTATNINVLSGAVYRFTNASHTTGFKLNLRGDGTPTTLSSLMTANAQAITVCVSVVSGGTAISFAATDYLTIDTNATVTIKWFGGTKPSANINSEDFYTFTIFKTGATAFTVFASQAKFAVPA